MIDKPDLKGMTIDELVTMMLGCSVSSDPSDKEFAQYCRDEIKLRKPRKEVSPCGDQGRSS